MSREALAWLLKNLTEEQLHELVEADRRMQAANDRIESALERMDRHAGQRDARAACTPHRTGH